MGHEQRRDAHGIPQPLRRGSCAGDALGHAAAGAEQEGRHEMNIAVIWGLCAVAYIVVGMGAARIYELITHETLEMNVIAFIVFSWPLIMSLIVTAEIVGGLKWLYQRVFRGQKGR